MNSEDDALVDEYLSSGGFMTLVEEDEEGNFVEIESASTGWESAVPSDPDHLPPGFICPFVPTSYGRIQAFLERCTDLSAKDVVFDLGCGDGRVLLKLAEQVGCRCVGVDIDSKLTAYATAKSDEAALSELCTWLCQDARTTNLSTATVVVLYLIPSALNQLSTFLWDAMKREGFRVVTFVYPLPWNLKEETAVQCNELSAEYSIFEYRLKSV